MPFRTAILVFTFAAILPMAAGAQSQPAGPSKAMQTYQSMTPEQRQAVSTTAGQEFASLPPAKKQKIQQQVAGQLQTMPPAQQQQFVALMPWLFAKNTGAANP